MTDTKAVVRKLEDGAHELGAELEGVFVPFARIEAANLEATITAGKNAQAREQEQDA